MPQSWGAKQSYVLVWRDLEGPVDRWEAVSAGVETGNVRSERDWRETRTYRGSERGWMVRSGRGRSWVDQEGFKSHKDNFGINYLMCLIKFFEGLLCAGHCPSTGDKAVNMVGKVSALGGLRSSGGLDGADAGT